MVKYNSSKPGKQRARLYNAPLHRKRKKIVAHLSKQLRAKYGRRSFTVRKGDEVKIMRGEFKGKKGKITKVICNNMTVNVEGITMKKTSGVEIPVPLKACNLMITSLNLDDKKRIEALKRSKGTKGGKHVE